MVKPDPNPNHNRDRDHDNDNGNDNNKGTVIPAPAGGALTSLTALAAVLNGVNTAAVGGRTGLPMMLFKREGDGTYAFGQKRTIPEEGSKWAVNVLTFKYGFICFDNNNKVRDERLVPISQTKPVITELPNTGFDWQEEWAVNLKCLSGTDAGIEVTFKATTDGGIKAVAGLVDLVRDRINGGRHDGKVVPIVLLEKDSYQHGQHGKVWIPVLHDIDWMPLDGPAPAAPEPTSPPPAEQPRRRRVA